MSLSPDGLVQQSLERIQETDFPGARRLLAEGALLIDVREESEHAAGAIPGDRLVPRGILEFEIGKLGMPEQPILLYCRSGRRSALAADSLQGLGYAKVWSLAGGYLAWEAAGRPALG
ncbi:MAG: hypothetical protein HYV16_05700 [Gammaproteobacteria bacterium]|nr:hypothetical protein [Gammaproteobacteria bacterium]